MSERLYKNFISAVSGVIMAAVFVVTAILLLLDYVGVELDPLFGMLAYVFFPVILIISFLGVLFGMYVEWRHHHRKEGKEPPRFPTFDFNKPATRRHFYEFMVVALLAGLLLMAVSLHVYEFTETVTFCGELCHKVMEPEATTYKDSPHARVTCVECHVGKGATWYVKSKIAGLYQVYATLFNKYPRPIETPVHNLRPSEDTCEQCHWPRDFIGDRQIMVTHYQEDEANTPRQFLMLMNVGGGLKPTGIHWHVGDDDVYYVARDEDRQDIPWIKVVDKDGKEVIYKDTESPPSEEDIARGELRKMDCIDCHNRPTHVFKTPKKAMDEALSKGRIDSSLPYIKKIGVEVLSKDYPSDEEASEKISEEVKAFYKGKYPGVIAREAGKIETAIAEMQSIWAKNNFPHMKSNWNTYPNNIGHMKWVGCFRCHTGKHKSDDGKVIVKNCSACHTFLSEDLTGLISTETSLGQPFVHPVDIGGMEKDNSCNMCHSGM